MRKGNLVATGFVALSVFCGSAFAQEDSADATEGPDRGDRVERRLDRQGDVIDRRLDRASQHAGEQGHDRAARRLDRTGDRVDRHLDRRGRQIDRRIDRRMDRRPGRPRQG